MAVASTHFNDLSIFKDKNAQVLSAKTKQTLNYSDFFSRLTAQIDADRQDLFTPDQISTLQKACRKIVPIKHRFDYRLSGVMPGGHSFYLTILGGFRKQIEL